MEYAKSLIKRKVEEDNGADPDAENATIRDSHLFESEYGSPPRTASDWSVIEDTSDGSRGSNSKRPSLDHRQSSGKVDASTQIKRSSSKRRSLVSNVLSVLPDALSSPTRPKAARTQSSPPTSPGPINTVI